jgi:putative nucleotidyltransferase with HDIG domain
MGKFEEYLNKLPVIPDVASKIISINEDSLDFSFRQLEEMISVDPMLTARILKVANSALYARQKEITTLQMAIGLIGFKTIKSLVLLLTASQFSRKFNMNGFYGDFWRHSIVTAFVAREIYYRNKDRINQDLAFTLGLLHDIGKVALYNADPERYKKIMETAERERGCYSKVEREYLGTDHQEVGAALMNRWNLPEVYGKACGFHGLEGSKNTTDIIIRNLAVADIVAGKMGYGQIHEHLDDDNLSFLKGSHVSDEDLEYFIDDYEAIMEDDPLFQECNKLFFSGSAHD